MTTDKRKHIKNIKILLLVTAGILLNMLGDFLTAKFGIPFYFDTIGTIVVAAMSGYVPGAFVALATNLIAGISDPTNAYYSILNVLIALYTSYFFFDFYLRGSFPKRFFDILRYILVLSIIGGVYGSFISWFVFGPADSGLTYTLSSFFDTRFKTGAFLGDTLASFVIDFIDKSISVTIALLIFRLFPKEKAIEYDFVTWKQKPLETQELDRFSKLSMKTSLRTKVSLLISLACISIAVIIATIALKLFRDYALDQHIGIASELAKAAADEIDGSKVDEFIEKGSAAEGYDETEKRLYRLKAISADVEYLYVYRITEEGCYVVFDLDTAELEGEEPGTLIDFDESFSADLPLLLAGKEIEPVISNDKYGWLLTVYQPVYDGGRCVCYVGVDVAMQDLKVYNQDFMLKLTSLGLGFFMLILSFSLWLAKFHIIFPVNTIAEAAGGFAYHSEEERGQNVEELKSLEIKTGDEVENLYQAVLKTTETSMQYYEEMQAKSVALTKLQTGLLIVLADIVENRDESTGNHVKKTAAYVEIILKALRKKGYYTDLITDDYISDSVRSAPLHDIGKISIPDAILNKPGKLSPEEFEIMKTHTLAGENIIEKAKQTLDNADYFGEAKNLAMYHHEKWNGTGYPRGLSGEDIPLSARVMAVADVFDALVSKRIYKPAMPFEQAMGIIQKDAGTHFDPKVAEVFIESIDEVREVADRFDLEFNYDA
ncbi:MAG: HD domain-containing protein [Lachnospiraceae bacterium]|nr:HD domain-containing protein [Lachnospiraceae bacterium]